MELQMRMTFSHARTWHLFLLVQVALARNIALLIDGHAVTDGQEDVKQSLVLAWLVNGGAEGLDEPGASLAASETVMVPEWGLQWKLIKTLDAKENKWKKIYN